MMSVGTNFFYTKTLPCSLWFFDKAKKEENKDKVASSLEAIGYSCSKPIYNLDGSANLEASRRVSFRFVINQQ